MRSASSPRAVTMITGSVRVNSPRARKPCGRSRGPRRRAASSREFAEVGRFFGQPQLGLVAALRRSRPDSLPPRDCSQAARTDPLRPRRSECAARTPPQEVQCPCAPGSLDRSCRVGFDVRPLPAVRPLGRQRRTRHQIDHGLGDVRRMIADPLDVLRAEQKVGAEGDVARILHHMRQEIAEHQVFQGRRARRPAPIRRAPARRRAGRRRRARPSSSSITISFMCLMPTITYRPDRPSTPILTERLAMFLARSPTRSRSPATRNGADDFAQVIGHRLPARDGQRRLLLDLALQRVEAGIGLHHLLRQRGGTAGGGARPPRRSPSSRPGRPSRRSAARAGQDPCRRL